MRHVNVLWLHKYYVRAILQEARDVPLAYWPLMAAEARKRMVEAGFDRAAITYVEDEIRHAMDLSSARCWSPPGFSGLEDCAKATRLPRRSGAVQWPERKEAVMRFSLRWLLGAMSFVAGACACLIFAESVETWIGLALHLFLLLSALGAFYAPRKTRAFWGGCALMGWYYLASGHLPSDLQQLRNMTQEALSEIHPKIAREVQTGRLVPRVVYAVDEDETTLPTEQGTIHIPSEWSFVGVGQALATFLLAFAGGGVALWFDRHASRKSPDAALPVSGGPA